jgi:hypothetical protein
MGVVEEAHKRLAEIDTIVEQLAEEQDVLYALIGGYGRLPCDEIRAYKAP